jgi:hypothetical protein
MKRYASCVAAIALMSAPIAHAADNDIDLTGIAQQAFKAFSEDMSSALSYKAVIPAEPLGITGFDIGIEVSSTKMSSADDWQGAVSGGDSIDNLIVPKLHVHKGLPFGIDLGAVYTSIPTTNIKLIGGELRYAFISGNVAIPALAVRGSFTKLSGVDDLSFSTKGLELSVSKGFAMLTPYAGLGRVWTTSDPSSDLPLLEKVDVEQTKYYVGANINFGLMNLALEGDKTGDSTTYSAKLGLRF